MNIKEIAEKISEISKKELALLYYSPNEVEKAITENRSVVMEENGKIAAFGFWNFYDDWVEISTLYVTPEFRGRGYLKKVVDGISTTLVSRNAKIFVFTRVPQVIHTINKLDFREASYSFLPRKIFWKVILHRAHPRRWPVYLLRPMKNLALAVRARLFIRDC